jgi:hypothetical protein
MCDRCGHDRTHHDHYRPGSDCAIWRCECPEYLQPASVAVAWGRRLTAFWRVKDAA